MTNITDTIATAHLIADNRHENTSDPLFGRLYGHPVEQSELVDVINCALSEAYNPTTPYMWAVMVDCQSALALLDRARAAEGMHLEWSVNDYREGAKRKLAEAISWLL